MIKIQTRLIRTRFNCAFVLNKESRHLIDEGKLKVGQEYEIRIIKKRKETGDKQSPQPLK